MQAEKEIRHWNYRLTELLTNHVLLGHGVLEDNDRGHNDDDPLEAVANRVCDWGHPLQDHVGHLHTKLTAPMAHQAHEAVLCAC